MGYRTIWNVPRIVHYADARKVYENTTPIRGKEVRPLGARRDYHTYSVRMAGEVVEFVLYRTPVVKFMPDDTVVIQNGWYPSQSTHQFIYRVLGISACGFSNKTKLEFSDGSIYMLARDEELVLSRDNLGRFIAGKNQERFGYSMNRKAVNNVRRRYKEFADYLKATLKLRTEEEPYKRYVYSRFVGGREEVTEYQSRVKISFAEMIDALGVVESGREPKPFKVNFAMLTQKQRYSSVGSGSNQREMFLSMITSDQPEEGKHDNFYKAFLGLCKLGRVLWVYDNNRADHKVQSDPENVLRYYDKALMMAHAKEVLTITKLEGNKLPNLKYEGWIAEEKTNEDK